MFRQIDGRRPSAAALAGDAAEHRLVLRSLIDRFGGEATGTELQREVLRRRPAAEAAQSATRIWALLAELGRCGALAFDDVDGTEVIVRITRDGADLACGTTARPG